MQQITDSTVTRAQGQASGLSEFAERHWTPGCVNGFENHQSAIGRFLFTTVRKEICYFESSLGEITSTSQANLVVESPKASKAQAPNGRMRRNPSSSFLDMPKTGSYIRYIIFETVFELAKNNKRHRSWRLRLS